MKHVIMFAAVFGVGVGALAANAASPTEAQARELLRAASDLLPISCTITSRMEVTRAVPSRESIEAMLKKALSIKEAPTGSELANAEAERLRVSVDAAIAAQRSTRRLRVEFATDHTSWRTQSVESSSEHFPAIDSSWTHSVAVDRREGREITYSTDFRSKVFSRLPSSASFKAPPIEHFVGMPRAARGAIAGVIKKSYAELNHEASPELVARLMSAPPPGERGVFVEIEPLVEGAQLLDEVRIRWSERPETPWVTFRADPDNYGIVYYCAVHDLESGKLLFEQKSDSFDAQGVAHDVLVDDRGPSGKALGICRYEVESVEIHTTEQSSANVAEWFACPDGFTEQHHPQ